RAGRSGAAEVCPNCWWRNFFGPGSRTLLDHQCNSWFCFRQGTMLALASLHRSLLVSLRLTIEWSVGRSVAV
ncbi:hypothetical protein KBX53_33155, partial [Micromonospora sp. M51]|uniref:hypothetical protein n=1 Tax=Micromonospora sp. M51 TaxID=2824889 RepID=UPI001B3913D7